MTIIEDITRERDLAVARAEEAETALARCVGELREARKGQEDSMTDRDIDTDALSRGAHMARDLMAEERPGGHLPLELAAEQAARKIGHGLDPWEVEQAVRAALQITEQE